MAGPESPTLGVILAGGLAQRLGGGDKALRRVGGRPLLDRLLARMAPQVMRLILNANGDPARFAIWGVPVAADTVAGRPGPLAGVLAALDWAAQFAPAIEWVASAPGDAPFLPHDLVARLHAERHQASASLACAASAGQAHHVAALWPVSIRGELRDALAGGLRKVGAFTGRYPCAVAEWPVAVADPFFNVNTPEDLTEADRLATLHPEL